MNYFKVKNWEKFQHYKDRCPPWIKLHSEIFASRDWVMLADASKLLMIICMLVAAKKEGKIPDDPEYIKRVSYLDKLPDFKPLLKTGFLLQADASGCYQEQAKDTTEERRDRGREETEKRQSNVPPADFMHAYEIYPGQKSRLNDWAKFRRHKDNLKALPLLKDAILSEISFKQKLSQGPNSFCPPWKNFQTWLSQRCWEQELTLPKEIDYDRERLDEIKNAY